MVENFVPLTNQKDVSWLVDHEGNSREYGKKN
jgi:hypothetical protein